ncbi:nitroreductase family protein [Cetobacterium sp.]|uniref:nitroreductase family protein n=1 Tax=Cetobacterium sp. TaxID=2071632 RepID=UPI002FC6E71C
MNFLARRTIREYTEEVVSEEKIQEILKVALFAPSSRNKRGVEFIVVRDKKTAAKLTECKKIIQNMPLEADFSVVVIADKTLSDTWIENSSVALTLMQLKAWDMGIGSCWMQVRGRVDKNGIDSEEVIKRILEIPEKYGVLALMTFGYPKEKKEGYEFSEVNNDRIHYEKY